MKRILSPATNASGLAVAPEAKVAAAAVIGYAVSLVLQALAAYVPHFHAPPATLVALIVTTLSGIAGWLAPHTYRAPRGVITGDLTAEPLSDVAVAYQEALAARDAMLTTAGAPGLSAERPPPVIVNVHGKVTQETTDAIRQAIRTAGGVGSLDWPTRKAAPDTVSVPPGILSDAERAQLAELQARAQAPSPVPSSDPRERQAQADMGGTAS